VEIDIIDRLNNLSEIFYHEAIIIHNGGDDGGRCSGRWQRQQ